MLIGLREIDPNKIRELRLAMNLSQGEFGHRVGRYPNTTVSRWERGEHQPNRTARRRLMAWSKQYHIDLYRVVEREAEDV